MKMPRRLSRRAAVRLVAAAVALLIVALGGLSAIAWHFSTLALELGHEVVLAGTAAPAGPGLVRISDTWDARLPGRYGLAWEGGYGTLGAVRPGGDPGTVVRGFTPVIGRLPQELPARIDPFAFTGDPRTAQGLDYSDVAVPGPLGDQPAWYVPAPGIADGEGRTWVIFVHGRGGDRREALRYLPTWHDAGLPTLVITYRNDLGAPASPDGLNHLGDTEWADVEAAVRYAVDAGAEGVVVAGWSMGGALALQTVDRSELAGSIRGLILDSPVVDWRDVFAYQGHLSGLPSAVGAVAIWTAERRAGVDLDRFDWVRRSGELDRPILLFATDDDTYVPDGPARRLAAARPDLVELVNAPGADHVRSWNVDPDRYRSVMRDWLIRTGQTAAPASAAASG